MGLMGGLLAASILIFCWLKVLDTHKQLRLKQKIDKEIEDRKAGKSEGEKSYAPWTQEQIVNLNAYQMNRHFHPMTCPRKEEHPPIEGERGRLLATHYGLVCPHCSYSQNWAHAFMTRRMLA